MKKRSKTSIFLMEMIIIIGFFAICSAICMQLFATAHKETKNSDELSRSSMCAEYLAETFKAKGGSLADMNMGVVDGEKLFLYYNENWEITTDSNAPFYCEINRFIQENNVASAKITIYSDNEILFSISVKTLMNGGAA